MKPLNVSKYPQRLLPCALLIGLAGCASQGLIATVGPDAPKPVSPDSPQWQTPLPGASSNEPSAAPITAPAVGLGDLLLDSLIARAQSVSPDISSARARFAQARAALVAADAQAVPSLTGVAEFNRAAFTFGGPVAYRTQLSAGVQATWELDLFGELARSREAAAARLQAAALRVSAVGVSVAAETANAYVMLRLCEQEQQQLAASEVSLQRSYTAVKAAASTGVVSGVELTRVGAQLADAQTAQSLKQAQCDKLVKAMVALTDVAEPELKAQLRAGHGRVPAPARFAIEAVPARVLEMRPDIAAAQADVAAASADIGVAEAQRYPALSLSGNLIPARVSLNGSQPVSVTTWSIGPALRLPLFDRGRRKANAEAARADYEAAASDLRAQVRRAVSEVEQSLVDINTLAQTVAQQQFARDQAQEQVRLLDLRASRGLSSVVDAETARRQLLFSQTQYAAQSAQWSMAWIGLYRALGGGALDATSATPVSASKDTP